MNPNGRSSGLTHSNIRPRGMMPRGTGGSGSNHWKLQPRGMMPRGTGRSLQLKVSTNPSNEGTGLPKCIMRLTLMILEPFNISSNVGGGGGGGGLGGGGLGGLGFGLGLGSGSGGGGQGVVSGGSLGSLGLPLLPGSFF